MKIIKGASRAETHWTARQLVEYMEDGTVDFNIDIHYSYYFVSTLYFTENLVLCNTVKSSFKV